MVIIISLCSKYLDDLHLVCMLIVCMMYGVMCDASLQINLSVLQSLEMLTSSSLTKRAFFSHSRIKCLFSIYIRYAISSPYFPYRFSGPTEEAFEGGCVV